MRVLRIILSVAFLIAGGFFIIAIISALVGNKNTLGDFLWSSYSFVSFGIPLLFFWLFSECISKTLQAHKVASSALMLVPFFMFSIALRIFLWDNIGTEPPFWVSTQLFGKLGAVVFWTFIGAVGTMIVTLFYVFMGGSEKNKISRNENFQNIKNSLSSNYGKSPLLLRIVFKRKLMFLLQTLML